MEESSSEVISASEGEVVIFTSAVSDTSKVSFPQSAYILSGEVDDDPSNAKTIKEVTNTAVEIAIFRLLVPYKSFLIIKYIKNPIAGIQAKEYRAIAKQIAKRARK